jgi:type IV secretory pathway VirD2 relaxase
VAGVLTQGTTTRAHLRYLVHAKGPQQHEALLFGPEAAPIAPQRFAAAAAQDPHQFRFVVSLPPGALIDRTAFVRLLMEEVAWDLGRRLDWVAATHYDTGRLHTHVALRGRDLTPGYQVEVRRPGGWEPVMDGATGERTYPTAAAAQAALTRYIGRSWGPEPWTATDLRVVQGQVLYIARHYLSHGLRYRADRLATQFLGPVRGQRLVQAQEQHQEQQAYWAELQTLRQQEQAHVQAQHPEQTPAPRPEQRPEQRQAPRQGQRH